MGVHGGEHLGPAHHARSSDLTRIIVDKLRNTLDTLRRRGGELGEAQEPVGPSVIIPAEVTREAALFQPLLAPDRLFRTEPPFSSGPIPPFERGLRRIVP